MLGPLATYAEPHCYDLCTVHAERLSVPRGWEVLRIDFSAAPPAPNADDLLALADAVREAAADRSPDATPVRGNRSHLEPPPDSPGTRRGHLRVLREQ